MTYAALFVACIALIAAAVALVVASRAHQLGSWSAATLRAQARARTAERRGQERAQPAVDAIHRHSRPEDPAPAAPAPPTSPGRAGGTQEYRAVPPPGQVDR